MVKIIGYGHFFSVRIRVPLSGNWCIIIFFCQNRIFGITCRKAYFNAPFCTWYERYFLFAVYRKLAESVSFCVWKVDLRHTQNFTALLRENQLSARKTTPIRLTFGVRRAKKCLFSIAYFGFLMPIPQEIYLDLIAFWTSRRHPSKVIRVGRDILTIFGFVFRLPLLVYVISKNSSLEWPLNLNKRTFADSDLESRKQSFAVLKILT